MNYIDRIFERCDIDGIADYLFYGEEPFEKQTEGYIDRLQKADAHLQNWLMAEFADFQELDRHSSFIYSAISDIQHVYMQIGFRAGIMLATDFFTKSCR